jgi:hypothetical protein
MNWLLSTYITIVFATKRCTRFTIDKSFIILQVYLQLPHHDLTYV